MSLEGHIENGVVVFDEPVTLAEGTPVRVEPIPQAAPPVAKPKTLLEQLANVVGAIDDLPADAAQNVDHYLFERFAK